MKMPLADRENRAPRRCQNRCSSAGASLSPRFGAHARAGHRGNDARRRKPPARRPDRHLPIENIKRQAVLAAHERPQFPFQGGDFLGAIHAADVKAQRGVSGFAWDSGGLAVIVRHPKVVPAGSRRERIRYA